MKDYLMAQSIASLQTMHHIHEEKCCGMVGAPFGIVGFETAFPLLYTNFVETRNFYIKTISGLDGYKTC